MGLVWYASCCFSSIIPPLTSSAGRQVGWFSLSCGSQDNYQGIPAVNHKWPSTHTLSISFYYSLLPTVRYMSPTDPFSPWTLKHEAWKAMRMRLPCTLGVLCFIKSCESAITLSVSTATLLMSNAGERKAQFCGGSQHIALINLHDTPCMASKCSG